MRKTCFFIAAVILGACASTVKPGGDWTAVGYLSPSATDNADVIGEFDTEAACRAAVNAWMSRQVVGNPVSGECLPTDRR